MAVPNGENVAQEVPLAISLIIPAFNEAAYLPRLLDTVDAARQQYRHGADRIEVIVADNASTDDTPRIAAARGCRVQFVEKRAIAASRNGGAQAARGAVLAFADADFRIHAETFNYIDSVMARPDYLGGATGLVMERWSWGIAATWYAIMPPLWMLGLDGGVWFCRRTDFVSVGGYNENRLFAEDVDFLLRLKKFGAPASQAASGNTCNGQEVRTSAGAGAELDSQVRQVR